MSTGWEGLDRSDTPQPPRRGARARALAVAIGTITVTLMLVAPWAWLRAQPRSSNVSRDNGALLGAPAATAQPSETTTTTTAPAGVVIVVNASGKNGAAARVDSQLKLLGYHTLAPATATNHRAKTAVQFRFGFQLVAARVAADLQLVGASTEPAPGTPVVSEAAPADVVVVLGTDSPR